MGHAGSMGNAQGSTQSMKLYPLGLVGESNYQPAIASCSEGERVFVCIEENNPFDDRALRVERPNGQVIGYIPRTSWLRDAIHDQGRGCAATIKSISRGNDGLAGVVIDVCLCDDDLRVRQYAAPVQTQQKQGSGFTGLIRGIFSGLK